MLPNLFFPEAIVETNIVIKENAKDPEFLHQRHGHAYRVLTFSGRAFVVVSVFCFGVIAYLKLQQSIAGQSLPHFATWLDVMEQETGTISLLFIAIVAAMLGKGMLMSVQMASAATIPNEDLHLVRQAVLEGKCEPIDQYVRLRALSGISGNFTNLGVTGLPLTTVFLTLVFSAIALLPGNAQAAFLDLVKLTLGAFIGSFVQGRVDQRRSIDFQKPNRRRRSDLPA
jgi:hypothetical protein